MENVDKPETHPTDTAASEDKIIELTDVVAQPPDKADDIILLTDVVKKRPGEASSTPEKIVELTDALPKAADQRMQDNTEKIVDLDQPLDGGLTGGDAPEEFLDLEELAFEDESAPSPEPLEAQAILPDEAVTPLEELEPVMDPVEPVEDTLDDGDTAEPLDLDELAFVDESAPAPEPVEAQADLPDEARGDQETSEFVIDLFEPADDALTGGDAPQEPLELDELAFDDEVDDTLTGDDAPQEPLDLDELAFDDEVDDTLTGGDTPQEPLDLDEFAFDDESEATPESFQERAGLPDNTDDILEDTEAAVDLVEPVDDTLTSDDALQEPIDMEELSFDEGMEPATEPSEEPAIPPFDVMAALDKALAGSDAPQEPLELEEFAFDDKMEPAAEPADLQAALPDDADTAIEEPQPVIDLIEPADTALTGDEAPQEPLELEELAFDDELDPASELANLNATLPDDAATDIEEPQPVIDLIEPADAALTGDDAPQEPFELEELALDDELEPASEPADLQAALPGDDADTAIEESEPVIDLIEPADEALTGDDTTQEPFELEELAFDDELEPASELVNLQATLPDDADTALEEPDPVIDLIEPADEALTGDDATQEPLELEELAFDDELEPASEPDDADTAIEEPAPAMDRVEPANDAQTSGDAPQEPFDMEELTFDHELEPASEPADMDAALLPFDVKTALDGALTGGDAPEEPLDMEELTFDDEQKPTRKPSEEQAALEVSKPAFDRPASTDDTLSSSEVAGESLDMEELGFDDVSEAIFEPTEERADLPIGVEAVQDEPEDVWNLDQSLDDGLASDDDSEPIDLIEPAFSTKQEPAREPFDVVTALVDALTGGPSPEPIELDELSIGDEPTLVAGPSEAPANLDETEEVMELEEIPLDEDYETAPHAGSDEWVDAIEEVFQLTELEELEETQPIEAQPEPIALGKDALSGGPDRAQEILHLGAVPISPIANDVDEDQIDIIDANQITEISDDDQTDFGQIPLRDEILAEKTLPASGIGSDDVDATDADESPFEEEEGVVDDDLEEINLELADVDEDMTEEDDILTEVMGLEMQDDQARSDGIDHAMDQVRSRLEDVFADDNEDADMGAVSEPSADDALPKHPSSAPVEWFETDPLEMQAPDPTPEAPMPTVKATTPPKRTPLSVNLSGLSDEQLHAALMQVIESKYGSQVESLIYEIVEQAVNREIDKVKRVLLEVDPDGLL